MVGYTLIALAVVVVAIVIARIIASHSGSPLQREMEHILEECGSATFLIDNEGHVKKHFTSSKPDSLSRAQILCRDTTQVFEWMDTASRNALQRAIVNAETGEAQRINLMLNGNIQPASAVVIAAQKGRYYLIIKRNADNSVEQQSMRARSSLTEHILDNLPLATTVKDAASRGAYLFWNKQAEQLYNVRPGKSGTLDATSIPAELQQVHVDLDREVCTNDAAEATIECNLLDGTTHKLLIQKRLIHSDDDRKWIISTTSDITQLDKQDRELEQKERDLRQALMKADESNRLKSEFLANMSHEVRTPLNGIVGFSECMVDTDDPEERRIQFNEIQRCSNHLSALVEGVIRLSQLESGEVKLENEPFMIKQLIREVATSSVGNVGGKPIKLYEELPDIDYGINADKEKIRTILSQFLSNAIKHTNEGRIILGYSTSMRKVRIFVRDTGIGIAPENQELVFERFSKVGSMIHGIGLGLSICRALARIMGGTVGVQSELGKGSTFYFDLPCTPFSRDDKVSALGKVVGRSKD